MTGRRSWLRLQMQHWSKVEAATPPTWQRRKEASTRARRAPARPSRRIAGGESLDGKGQEPRILTGPWNSVGRMPMPDRDGQVSVNGPPNSPTASLLAVFPLKMLSLAAFRHFWGRLCCVPAATAMVGVGGGKPLGHSVFAGHAAAGAAAISASAVAVHPLDTVKTLLQLGAAGQKEKMGLRQVVDRLMAASGPAGFYSGIGWSIMGKLPGLGARFGTYELLTAFYKDGRVDNYVYYSEAMLAGIAAGAAEAVFCTPFELLKLRNQVSSVIPSKAIGPANVAQESFPLLSKLLPGYVPDIRVWNNTVSLLSDLSPKHPDMLGALKQHPWMLTGSGKPPLPSDVHLPSRVILLEGWGALWRGLRSGIARDCVFGGMFFSTWQFLHTAMLTWKAVNMNPEPRNLEEAGPVPPFASSVAAGFAGVVAAAASHTFDTAKSRSECTVVPKYIAMERKFLKWKAPGTWIERKTGISPADRNVLFRGIGLRMARSGIASFVLVGSYYLAVNQLS